jgi:hypothetical protein
MPNALTSSKWNVTFENASDIIETSGPAGIRKMVFNNPEAGVHSLTLASDHIFWFDAADDFYDRLVDTLKFYGKDKKGEQGFNYDFVRGNFDRGDHYFFGIKAKNNTTVHALFQLLQYVTSPMDAINSKMLETFSRQIGLKGPLVKTTALQIQCFAAVIEEATCQKASELENESLDLNNNLGDEEFGITLRSVAAGKPVHSSASSRTSSNGHTSPVSIGTPVLEDALFSDMDVTDQLPDTSAPLTAPRLMGLKRTKGIFTRLLQEDSEGLAIVDGDNLLEVDLVTPSPLETLVKDCDSLCFKNLLIGIGAQHAQNNPINACPS